MATSLNSHRSPSLRFLLLLLALLALAFAGQAAEPPATPDAPDLREVMERAVVVVKPALVRIHVVSLSYANGHEVKEEAYGSGVIIDKRGYVITNHHVAGDASYITCTLADKQELEADLVGSDPLTDIAIVKLRVPQERVFPFVTFGDSSAVKPGDRVFAMGSPLAYSQSVTMGIVSNTELVMPDEYNNHWLMLDGEDVGSVIRWIGHDAAIFPGNSGGPLVNLKGEVIGINEVDVGLGGAIPSNLAHDIAGQLIAHGKITRSWLGLSVQPLLKSERGQHGVLLTGALDGSPAEKAGLKSGDILLKLGDKPVDVRFPEELPPFNQMVMALPIGTPVTAVVLRDGKELTLTLTPLERQSAKKKEQELKSWGICASNLTMLRAKEMKRKDAAGVMVTSLRSGGPADTAKPALSENDIITRVADKPVNNLDDLRRITQELLAGKTEPVPVLVTFERRTDKYLTVVRVGLRDLADRGEERPKPWLPVSLQVLTKDLAEALGMPGRTGVRITQVYPHTAAQQAGLQVGDVITAIDKVSIEASEPEDVDVLPDMIRQGYEIGGAATLTVYRDKKPLEIAVTLPASPRLPREMPTYHDEAFEFAARDLSFIDRVQQGLSEAQQGALVQNVEDGGWAALARLVSNDLITAINGQPIANVEALKTTMGKIAAEKPEHITVLVKRDFQNIFLEFHAQWSAKPVAPAPANIIASEVK